MLLAVFLWLAESVVNSHPNVESHFGCILEMHDALLLMPAVLISVRDLSGVADIIRMPQRERFGCQQRGYPQTPYGHGMMPGTPILSKPSTCTDMSVLFFWISPKGFSQALGLCDLFQHNILYHVRVFTH